MMNVKPGIADRTKSFALRIIRLCAALPKTMEARVIGKQILRSGTSVGALLVTSAKTLKFRRAK